MKESPESISCFDTRKPSTKGLNLKALSNFLRLFSNRVSNACMIN